MKEAPGSRGWEMEGGGAHNCMYCGARITGYAGYCPNDSCIGSPGYRSDSAETAPRLYGGSNGGVIQGALGLFFLAIIVVAGQFLYNAYTALAAWATTVREFIASAQSSPKHFALVAVVLIGAVGSVYLLFKGLRALVRTTRNLAASGEIRHRQDEVGKLYENGDYESAVEKGQEAAQLARRSLGATHPRTLACLNTLGMALHAHGRLDEADAVFTQELAARQRSQGREHPDTLVTINSLALLRVSQGRPEEAERMHRFVLPVRERKLGKDNPETLISVNNLAEVVWQRGDKDEAERLLKRALEGLERVMGRDHHLTLTTVSNLALLHDRQGRKREAEPRGGSTNSDRTISGISA